MIEVPAPTISFVVEEGASPANVMLSLEKFTESIKAHVDSQDFSPKGGYSLVDYLEGACVTVHGSPLLEEGNYPVIATWYSGYSSGYTEHWFIHPTFGLCSSEDSNAGF